MEDTKPNLIKLTITLTAEGWIKHLREFNATETANQFSFRGEYGNTRIGKRELMVTQTTLWSERVSRFYGYIYCRPEHLDSAKLTLEEYILERLSNIVAKLDAVRARRDDVKEWTVINTDEFPPSGSLILD